MKKKKSLIRRLIVWILVLAAAAALVIFVGIPLYGPQPESTNVEPDIHYYEGGTKAVVMENDNLKFEMDPTTTQFTLTDKKGGEVWYSNPTDAASDKIALSGNKESLNCTLKVSYSTDGGTVELNNYAYSIQNQNYLIEQLDDGSVAVHYAIGKIDRTYLLPVAITVDRFNEWMDRIGSKDAKKVKSNYTLYEPAKLDSKDNKDEIIAMYPSVTEQALYILKSSTSASNKAKIEGYFTNAGYTQEEYEIDQQNVAGAGTSNAPVFNVTVVYSLSGDDLVVTVPYDEIRYREDYPITAITVLPMFGAVGKDQSGSLFVPEGGGALINCNNGKLSQNSYYANVYGWDYATYRDEAVSETRAYFPVFGIIRDNASFVCMLEGASSYASIQADISMRYNSYNYVNAKYTVLHADQYNVSAKTAQLVYMYEKEIPHDTIVQRYRFLNSGSYVDMAAAYGTYLKETYPSMAEQTSSEEVPVSVELVGAIDKTVVKLGLPIDSVVSTTTFDQADAIISDLIAGGADGLNIRYVGWSNGGINQKVLTGVHTLNELGGESGLKKLIASAAQKGATLYLDGISCFAYDSDLLDGFIAFRDAARYTTREQVKLYPYDIITYVSDESADPYYLVKPSFADRCASNLRSKLTALGAAGIGYRDIGYLLSGDYYVSDTVTREQVKAMNVAQLKASRDAGLKVSVVQGNDYALPYADLITAMDLDGISYTILDKEIPFYQIAIHGTTDYTGEAINLAGDWQEELLCCAEYGAGLHFSFMAEDAEVLQDTVYSGYCGAWYTAWSEDVKSMISRYRTEMAGLNQQKITGHEAVTANLTVTTYADGTQVYVNYGTEDAAVNGITVPARDYHVERAVTAQ